MISIAKPCDWEIRYVWRRPSLPSLQDILQTLDLALVLLEDEDGAEVATEEHHHEQGEQAEQKDRETTYDYS